MAARNRGNRYSAPGGGGPAPDDSYLNHPRGGGGAASMTRTGGTDAAGTLNASSSVADYLKARGAAPADGMGRSKPPVRRGGVQPAGKAGGGGKGPGGRPNSMAQGGPQRGGPVRPAGDTGQVATDLSNLRQGGAQQSAPPTGAAMPPIGAASGNPSAARAAAFNAQRLAGPARPVADNGLAGRPNPSGGVPVTGDAARAIGGALGMMPKPTGATTTGMAGGVGGPPQRMLGPPQGAPQPAAPKVNVTPSPSNAPNAGGLPQPPASSAPKPQGPSPAGSSSTGAGVGGRIVTPRGGRTSLA